MKKVCISKDWKFSSPDYTQSQPVDLPHDYTITLPRDPKAPGKAFNGYVPGETALYEKFVRFEEVPHTILDVDGAYMCARFAVNDRTIAMHPHGYAPFLLDLTDHITPGKHNKLSIGVENIQPSTRWYSGSGIYRDVYVWTGGCVRIEPWDLFVSTASIENEVATLSVKACISADMVCNASITFTVFDKKEQIVAEQVVDCSLIEGKNDCEFSMAVVNPALWDCENPNLYTMQFIINVDGREEDSGSVRFGIRTMTFDAENGFRLNGKTVKMKGGCIHHDHGALGSAEFPTAVRRKIQKLRAVGYNAVRSAHYPPSLTLLEVCDELGMLLMDEAFDMWMHPKTNRDYSLWFQDWWARDISYMVKRDRNHPCVTSYSIGNEISEIDGSAVGIEWAKKLSAEIRQYDLTRPVTAGVCCPWYRSFSDFDAPEDYKEVFMEGFHDAGGENLNSSFAKRTEKVMAQLDIVGYNYLYNRYEHDHKLYPERVIWGSETHALNFYHSWQSVLRNDHVIGDFTWTAYDNVGEAGTGRFAWGEDGEYVSHISCAPYPFRLCYQGDFDLAGFRRPQSYFREAIWSNGTAPHIFTWHPKHNGDIFSGTFWHWHDVSETWTFDDRYLGKSVKTELYTVGDSVTFILNGREIGTVKPEAGIATLDIPYEKGKLVAVVKQTGKEDVTATLNTIGTPFKVHVEVENGSLIADNRDLCYIDIAIQDENGNLCPDADNEIVCEVHGGELLAVFSGEPNNEDQYGSNRCHMHHGQAVAVIRCKREGSVWMFVQSDGLKPGLTQGNIYAHAAL